MIIPTQSLNVRSAIVAPSYTNLKLYNDGYTTTVSLHISEDTATKIRSDESIYPIIHKGKHYIHWEKFYHYSTSFDEAFNDATRMLKEMMVRIRKAKILALQNEIAVLEDNIL